MVKWLPALFMVLLTSFFNPEGFWRSLATVILMIIPYELLYKGGIKVPILVISYLLGLGLGFTFLLYWQHCLIFGLLLGFIFSVPLNMILGFMYSSQSSVR